MELGRAGLVKKYRTLDWQELWCKAMQELTDIEYVLQCMEAP